MAIPWTTVIIIQMFYKKIGVKLYLRYAITKTKVRVYESIFLQILMYEMREICLLWICGLRIKESTKWERPKSKNIIDFIALMK